MTTISKTNPDFKTFERTIFVIMCQIACQLMRQYLELRDKTIMALRDTKQYRLIDSRETTIKTLMGEVRYKRRYYKNTVTGGRVFLLDEAMGIDNQYGLLSENLAEQIAIECTEKSFRNAASSISTHTGQAISRMGAWLVLQRYGKSIEEQEVRLQALYDSGSVGHLGNKSTSVVFEEYDDVWISRQPETRRTRDEIRTGKKKPPKIGKKPMHVGIAYTGWEQSGERRYRTADKMAYASLGSASAFITTFETLLNNVYDMDGVKQRITNGDGESWIRTSSETNDTILQLDPYHRNEKVIRSVSEKSDKRDIFKALMEKDVEKSISTISELVFEADDEKRINKLIELHNYFENNKDILLTWQERGIELPKPPEGITYRNLGTMESNNNCLITQRMKHRKGSWGEEGANHMAKILCIRNTIGLESILGSLPEAGESEYWIEPLSATKAPAHDGKGYGADWLYAQMPFEQAFKTNGREAIRNIFRLKPLSQLPFLRGS